MKKWKLCNEAIFELLQMYGAVKKVASCHVWSPSTFLWLFIPFEWFLGSFCWNLSELEYIWNVNNVKWIIWFCPWKVNIFFNYFGYIVWAISLTLTQVFVSKKKEIVRKIHAFENYDGLSVAKWALHICVLFIFLASHF